ncbi:carboxylesterase/lipase family protein [Pedobacter nototheniae]|uniref:carboxylesterase/lipase family protein n=1 Tax=Pedobacter nototheniae TaxID=2488994 RepID=UPI00103B0E82|nr:carboxylesterase family protein [Pedobacter nototheniae]
MLYLLRTACLKLFLFCLFSLVYFSINAQENAVVKISNGYLKGIKEEKSYIFKGIPYAEAPIDSLRFKAPKPKINWTDTLACQTFGNAAAQFDGNSKTVKGSEDCLKLNVYTPALNTKKKMAVLVWVHGGGMTNGSGSSQNGHAFADVDSIVTVTINYRLGIFGFLYLADKNYAYSTAGNNGLLDLMMSLTWIKNNIEAFGGDPNQVTVIGESAGAKLTSTLLLTPAAKNLYHQLILESGGVQCVRDIKTARAIRTRLVKKLNLHKPEDLLSLSTKDLISAQNEVCKGAQGTNYFGPVADGLIISGNPYDYIIKNTAKEKRFLIGTNKVESRMFMDMDKRLYHPNKKVLKDWFGKNAGLILKDFKKNERQFGTDSAAKITLTQYMYTMHSYRLANKLSTVNNNIWMYRFDLSKDGKPATHAAELPYVWFSANQSQQKINTNLATVMHQYWVSFIKGQKPVQNKNTDTTLSWPVYQKNLKQVIIFDQNSRTETLAHVFDDPKFPAACFILR